MKRLSSYSFYSCLLAGVLFLSSCGSSRRVTKTEPPNSKPPVVVQQEPSKKAIKETYANLMGVTPHDITNYALYTFIDDWYSVPYKFAGRTKQGVDCSDLVCLLYDKVYGASLAGNCSTLLSECKPVKQEDLKEGDLVFFKINSDNVSHVGIYLQNNHFVHASVHKGVVISNLTDDYYKKYFYKGGRLKTSLTQNSYKG